MARDLVVAGPGGARLAVRDHGGSGPPLILLHGAGTHLESLNRLAAELGHYRVVATDQRWSGQSSDEGEYDWDLLVDDVEAVSAGLGLDNPAVGGHSWGGMIAAHYGARHPEAPAVFNLDGHGPGDPSLYDGMTAEEVEATRSKLVGFPDWMGSEGDEDWKERAFQDAFQMASAMGLPEAAARAWAWRDFVDLGGGRWRRHPGRALSALAEDQNMFDVYRRVDCPALIVLTASNRGLPDELVAVMEAYRRGLDQAFARLAAERTNWRVVKLSQADHNGLAGRYAKETGATVSEFLTQVGYSADGRTS